MGDLNRHSILGRLGADPEIRSMQNGEKCANFRVATGERWKDKNSGETKERTEWHSVVVFGPAVGIVEQYLRKGARALVEGPLRTRKWQDQSGNDRYTTELVVTGFSGNVQVIDWPDDGGGRARGQEDSYGNLPGTRGGAGYDQSPAGYNRDKDRGSQGGGYSDMNDEIPF